MGTAAILLGAMNLQVFSSQPLGSATVSPLCLPGLVELCTCAAIEIIKFNLTQLFASIFQLINYYLYKYENLPKLLKTNIKFG